MTARRRRKRRTQVNRRIAPVLAALVLIVLIAAAVFISYLIDKYSPSKERMEWTEYYSMEAGDEAAVILDNELTEIRGRMIDGEAYVTTDVLYDYLNPRFYWDQAENLLLYTTPTEVITAAVGSNTYTAGSESVTESYVPVKVDGDTAYVAEPDQYHDRVRHGGYGYGEEGFPGALACRDQEPDSDGRGEGRRALCASGGRGRGRMDEGPDIQRFYWLYPQ